MPICQVKYLNNLIEQDHRFIKKITKPIMGVNAFHSTKATIITYAQFYARQALRLSEALKYWKAIWFRIMCIC